jgi:coproporphyrinogen III oxidase-like Fe-S oxidoreductase
MQSGDLVVENPITTVRYVGLYIHIIPLSMECPYCYCISHIGGPKVTII